MTDPATINCAEACVNGCILGDQCPHLETAKAAREYINNTDWDTIMETAAVYTARGAAPPPDLDSLINPDLKRSE
ncbi:MAG: hypothetical protein WCA07_08785 [Gloeobacterales cyanobacterium]